MSQKDIVNNYSCFLGVLQMSRRSVRSTASAWMTCWKSLTLWCWHSTWPLKARAWSATESCLSWNPWQRWSTSAEVRTTGPLAFKVPFKELQALLLSLSSPCARRGRGSGRFSWSTAVRKDPRGSTGRDRTRTFTEVSHTHSQTD